MASRAVVSKARMCALILANHSPVLLARLLRRLESYGVVSFVHVDRKAEISNFAPQPDIAGATFLDRRVDIRWGGFSIVEATLNLIDTALKAGNFTHFLLLSGDSYPIRSRADFYNYFACNSNHIQVRQIAPSEVAYQRIARVYIPDSRVGAFLNVSGDPSVVRYIDPEFLLKIPALQEAALLKSQPFPWKYAKGSQWWCLTRSAIESLLDAIAQNDEFVRWFRHSSVPDESFFHSIFLNFLADPITNDPPVFTLWDRTPKPYVFTTPEDFALLDGCKRVLARKFSEKSIVELDRMDASFSPKRARPSAPRSEV